MSLLRKAISLLFTPKSPKGDFGRVLIIKGFLLGTKGGKKLLAIEDFQIVLLNIIFIFNSVGVYCL